MISRYDDMKIIIILLSLCLQSTFCQHNWNWNQVDSNRNDRAFNPPRKFSSPQVPNVQQRSHSSSGQDWNFNTRLSRASGHYSANDMVNGIPYGKSGYRGSAMLYVIDVDTSASFLTVMTNGGSGDVDIYVRYGEYPTKRLFDKRSAHQGSQEQVIFDSPRTGRYYIVLYGYNNYESTGFEAEFR